MRDAHGPRTFVVMLGWQKEGKRSETARGNDQKHGRYSVKSAARALIRLCRHSSLALFLSLPPPLFSCTMAAAALPSVHTVLGPVAPAALGPTLPHEHLLIEFQCAHCPPKTVPVVCGAAADEPCAFDTASLPPIGDVPTLGWLRHNPYSYARALFLLVLTHSLTHSFACSHPENIQLASVDEAVAEMKLLRHAGGRTLVDATTIGIGRNALAVREIAERSHVNVVLGTGFYVAATHPSDMSSRSVDDLRELMVRELTSPEGIDGTYVLAPPSRLPSRVKPLISISRACARLAVCWLL